MRIARIDIQGQGVTWAALDAADGSAAPIRGEMPAWAPIAARGDRDALDLGDPVSASSYRLLAPVEPGGRIFGMGANYTVHVGKLGGIQPTTPAAFLKHDAAIIGPDDEMWYPAITNAFDFEIELIPVVAGPLDHSRDPYECVLGYTLGSDTSARDAGAPLGGVDLYGMKALDHASPVGPWIVTLDEFGLAQPELEMRLHVNGELRQQCNTREMIWTVADCLTFLDPHTALRCGDIVFTGTCAGVGMEDGRYLQPGDVVTCSIEHIGEMSNIVGPRAVLSAEARARYASLSRPELASH